MVVPVVVAAPEVVLAVVAACPLVAAVCVLFAYLAVSNFVRAARRGRRKA